LLAQRNQLLDGGGPVEIQRVKKGGFALALEPAGELGGGGGLARAVEAYQEDARRGGEVERGGVATQEGGQLVLENFDDLLAGRDAAQHVFAQRLGLDPCDEVLGHLVVDISFQQRHADGAHGVGDVRFGDRAVTAQIFEDVLEFIGELTEHWKKGRRV